MLLKFNISRGEKLLTTDSGEISLSTGTEGKIYIYNKFVYSYMHVLRVLIICCLIHWDNLKQIMKRMYKQWWSTIPLISTKWIITSHLNHWIKKTTTYNMGNPGPDLGQAQKCGWVTLVHELMGSQPSPSDNWISNNNTDILWFRFITYSCPKIKLNGDSKRFIKTTFSTTVLYLFTEILVTAGVFDEHKYSELWLYI